LHFKLLHDGYRHITHKKLKTLSITNDSGKATHKVITGAVSPIIAAKFDLSQAVKSGFIVSFKLAAGFILSVLVSSSDPSVRHFPI
jgi:hypothetical protein